MIIPAFQTCSSHSDSTYHKAAKTVFISLLFEYYTTQLYPIASPSGTMVLPREKWPPGLADNQPLDRKAPGASESSQFKSHSSAILTSPLKGKQTNNSVYSFAKGFTVTYIL